MKLRDLSWWHVIALVLFRYHKPMRNVHIQDDPLIAEYRLTKGLDDRSLERTISLHLTIHSVPGASRRSLPLVFDKSEDGLWILNDLGVQMAAQIHSQLDTNAGGSHPKDLIAEATASSDVLEYLEEWRHIDRVSDRIETLIEAYQIAQKSNRLAGWRFVPGRRDTSREPMHCAFAATPFLGDDFFILRCVRGRPGQQSKDFAIGFCPDYGAQEPQGVRGEITRRRDSIRDYLDQVRNQSSGLPANVAYPAYPRSRVHAFKGFEVRIPDPGDGNALADRFVHIVTTWERLFSSAPTVKYPRRWQEHEYLALFGVLSQHTKSMDPGSRPVQELASILQRSPDEVARELNLISHMLDGGWALATASDLPQIWTKVAVDGELDVIGLGRALPNPQSSDSAEPPSRIAVTTLRVVRDTALSDSIKRLYTYKCQICGTRIPLGVDSWYAEVHHLKPLGDPHKGPDLPGNMLCLCPNHHAEFDLGVIALDPALRILHLDPNNEYVGRKVMLQPGHSISLESTAYHREHIYRGRC